MKLKRAIEILEEVSYEMSLISSQGKAGEKAWSRLEEACKVVLKELAK